MRSAQFYKYATYAMLLLNLVTLGFFFFNNTQNKRGGRAIDTLKLDTQQHDLFMASADKHRVIIEGIGEQQKVLLKPYFKQLVNQSNRINEDELLEKMKELESQKITATYRHFSEIKNILNENQIADFEGFIDRMLARILVETEKKPLPPKDFKK